MPLWPQGILPPDLPMFGVDDVPCLTCTASLTCHFGTYQLVQPLSLFLPYALDRPCHFLQCNPKSWIHQARAPGREDRFIPTLSMPLGIPQAYPCTRATKRSQKKKKKNFTYRAESSPSVTLLIFTMEADMLCFLPTPAHRPRCLILCEPAFPMMLSDHNA